MDCYLKMLQEMVTPTNYVFARAGFTLRRALVTLKIFVTSFHQIYVKIKKKSLHLIVGLLAGTIPYYGKFGPS